MDREKTKRRQSLKVIISESIMVLAVIITVAVLAFVVSGYWVNSDFEVERQGMLQISSVPTGADVVIDDKSAWLQRTNTSKVLPSGEHTVTLTKEGYDTWSKSVNIKEGLLYRIHYPRLFLKNRTASKVSDVTGTTFATMNSEHNAVLLINNTTKWQYLDLTSEEIKPKVIDISKYFSSVSLAEGAKSGLFNGKIVSAHWDYDGNHVLFKVTNDQSSEWVLIDVKNPDRSVNLTKDFGSDFYNMKILDNNSGNILAVQNGNLHRINISGKQLSSVLVENIQSFDHYENEIVFSATKASDQGEQPYVGYFKAGDNKITQVITTPTPAKTLIGKFYDHKYIAVLEQNKLAIYDKDDLESKQESKQEYELSFVPDKARIGHDGEYVIMSKDNHIATFDFEANVLREWNIEGERFGWIDNDMIYTVSDSELIVYDFDGFNRRALSHNVSDHFPVGIADNKWLYYFSDDHLMREWIVEH